MGAPVASPSRFYRLRRTGLADYDGTGFNNLFEENSAPGNPGGESPDSFVANFTGPPLPPVNVIEDLRIGNPGIPATVVSRDSGTQLVVTQPPSAGNLPSVIFTAPSAPTSINLYTR